MTKKEECDHFTVRRILGSWQCLECGLEFVPKGPKDKGSEE